MAKGLSRILALCVIALICQNAAGRSLLAKKKTHQVDWRAPSLMEMTITLGDRVSIWWERGPKTGVLQMAYPGICTDGEPASPYKKFTGMKASGSKSQSARGKLKLKPTVSGSIFLTSSIKGECDDKWLRINIVLPTDS